MQLMRTADRVFAGKAVSAQAGIAEAEFQGLRRHERHAAFSGGLDALRETGWDAAPPQGEASGSGSGDVWAPAAAAGPVEPVAVGGAAEASSRASADDGAASAAEAGDGAVAPAAGSAEEARRPSVPPDLVVGAPFAPCRHKCSLLLRRCSSAVHAGLQLSCGHALSAAVWSCQ